MSQPRPRTQRRQERAALYVRVSLDRSAHGLQEEIISPETQEDRARSYCHAQGWQVLMLERDIDESAYRQHYSRRAGLMRLLAAVAAGDVTKIVVWKFSRLSRRLKEFIEICDRVESHGGGVVSVSEQVDTSTPSGRLIRNILASFAQFQSEELSEQISETWMTIAKKGLRPAGLPPYGTTNHRGMLEPNPETHPHLVAMYRTFRDTGSLTSVWDYLNRHQVPAPRAGEWNLNTIRGILTNPVYVGRIDWAGETFDARWDPLLPVELWEEVQQLINARRTLPVGRRHARMLTGLVKCGQCGRPMWTRYAKRSAGGRTHLARLYWCCSPANGRKGCGGIPSVHGEELESEVWARVMRLLAGRRLDDLVALAQQRHLAGVSSDTARRRRQLEAEHERTKRAAVQLFDLLADQSITQEQFRGQNARYLERLRDIEDELAALPATPMPPSAAALQHAVARAEQAITDQERREVLAALGAEIWVTACRVYLDIFGLRIILRGRRLGDCWHFRPEYQRLNYQGALFTDRQLEFLRRTYGWADKRRIAARLGRDYGAIVSRARALGLSPQGRGRWRRKKTSEAVD